MGSHYNGRSNRSLEEAHTSASNDGELEDPRSAAVVVSTHHCMYSAPPGHLSCERNDLAGTQETGKNRGIQVVLVVTPNRKRVAAKRVVCVTTNVCGEHP